MYRGLSILAMAPVLNEEAKIGEVVRRTPRAVVDEVLVVDDGSTDRSPEVARSLGATVLPLGATVGVGAAIRAGRRRVPDPAMSWPRRVPRLLLLLALALAAGGGWWLWRNRPPLVEVGLVIRGPAVEAVYATGTVEPVRWAPWLRPVSC